MSITLFTENEVLTFDKLSIGSYDQLQKVVSIYYACLKAKSAYCLFTGFSFFIQTPQVENI